MDNKKWYKKFATIFWWVITILPVIVALIQFCGYHLTFNSGINQAQELAGYHDLLSGNFMTILNTNLNNFDNFTMSGLKTTFSGLFNILGVGNYTDLGILFGYMLSVQVYHLLFDLLVFFIHLLHNYMDEERWFKCF